MVKANTAQKPALKGRGVVDLGDFEQPEAETMVENPPPPAVSPLSSDDSLADSLLDVSPTPPKPGDPPGFRRAFNKAIRENNTNPALYDHAEKRFLAAWNDKEMQEKGLYDKVRVVITQRMPVAPRIGSLDLSREHPQGLQANQRISLPRFAALHLVDRGKALMLGQADG